MTVLAIDLKQPILYYKSGEFSAEAGWKHKKMFHDEDFEIIFCLENQLSLLIDGQPIHLKCNDCLILPPETLIEGAQLSTSPVRFYWLHFYGKWQTIDPESAQLKALKKAFVQHEEMNDSSLCLLPRLFAIKEPNFFIVLINQLLNVTNSHYYSSKMADTLTQAILIELCNQYLTSTTHSEEHDSKIQQIADWIRANMSAELTIQEISDHFEVSQDYLSRQFKKEFGQNLRDYLINLKISVAKVLLIQTTLPIKVISELAYYVDEKYFTRMFKKRTGLTPSRYRKAYSGTHQNNPYIDPKLPIPQSVEKLLQPKPNKRP
ncbi:helix-turn-helix domain-containing protein [Enterococcus sp. DIV0800]|uniref:helix-turn-helix domain-containing protein n=1 Tax=unclassified Enterococcus TaxID=2608891 RepID=UPI003D301652